MTKKTNDEKNNIVRWQKTEAESHVRQNRSAQLTHHPPASFSSYQLYRMKIKHDFDKKKSKKQRRKKQNDNKGKIMKNTIVKSPRQREEGASDKTELHLTYHSPASFSSYQFSFSLTSFICGMWKQCDFDILYKTVNI